MIVKRHAFSLVELSIVLVILGLLIGGILAGQSLVHAAELRKLSTQQGKFSTAYRAFRDKYFGLPGDITNATSFWGTVAGNGSNSTCYATATTASTPGTCNGNGNGQINTANGNETLRFWQHLAFAGLIEGTYNGLSSDGVYNNIGVSKDNSPVYKEGFWFITFFGTQSGSSTYYDGQYGNLFQIGTQNNVNNTNNQALFTPEDAWNFDMKLDDGMPATGKVLSRRNSNCNITTAPSDLTATYNLTYTSAACAIMIFAD